MDLNLMIHEPALNNATVFPNLLHNIKKKLKASDFIMSWTYLGGTFFEHILCTGSHLKKSLYVIDLTLFPWPSMLSQAIRLSSKPWFSDLPLNPLALIRLLAEKWHPLVPIPLILLMFWAVVRFPLNLNGQYPTITRTLSSRRAIYLRYLMLCPTT